MPRALIDFLYHTDVDALIVQDLGLVSWIRRAYPDFELHASTQMHIHNREGVRWVRQLGMKRAVLARETPSNWSGSALRKGWIWRFSSTAPCASVTAANA